MNLIPNLAVKLKKWEHQGQSKIVRRSSNCVSEKIVKKEILMLLSLSVLCACASTEKAAEEAENGASNRGSDCIWEGSIRDYTVLDESNLIVRESRSRNYHMVLSRRAYGLRSSWQIGFRSGAGRICGGSSDIIIAEGFPDRSSLDRSIRIDSIRSLTPDEVDDLLIRFGKKEPEIEQPRPPEEVDGAEVEELD